MRRFITGFLLLAGCAAVAAVPTALAQDLVPATVIVTLPADARLFFDNVLTNQPGSTRSFTTPALQVGKNYNYGIRVELTRDGQTQTQKKTITVTAGGTTRVDFSGLDPVGVGGAEPTDGPDSWPRKATTPDGTAVTVYQPQLEKWDANRLEARIAVSMQPKAAATAAFGVAWISARTNVDKEDREVALDDFKLSKVSFPSAKGKEAEYLDLLRTYMPNQTRTISLDRLQAGLAVTQNEKKAKQVTLKNDAPRVFYSSRPAILVLIDGQPALRQVEGSTLLRVINTRELILVNQTAGMYYLYVFDRWLETKDVAGPWTISVYPPAELTTVLAQFRDNPQVDLLTDLSADLKDAFEDGHVPTIFVSTDPAELIEVDGDPNMQPIDGTKLMWIKNSTDQIVLDTATSDYYILLSGRWFRSKALQKGPWEYVAADKLPADIAKIPETHPRGDVLVSVPGTPQAQESLIANQVPQTGVIKRSEAKCLPSYDGDPKFEPIEGTRLQYAVNTPTPVIQFSPTSYYAVENGVWFTSSSPLSGWVAATSVPPAIYDIPASSPVNYATNVYVYDSTPDYVYTGYTPGYMGTYYSPYGSVVYGSGWYWRPWIGSYWWGRPWTYGFGARFNYWGGNWGFGYASGVGRPWWGPVGWNSRWGGNWWRPGWDRGYGAHLNNVHLNNINFGNVNVYNRWNSATHINTVRAAGINNYVNRNLTGVQRNLNNIYSSRDGDIFRRTEGAWETRGANNWQRFTPNTLADTRRPDFDNINRQLNNDFSARRIGDANFNSFRSTSGAFNSGARGFNSLGGYGAFHGAAGGYRGGSLGGFGGGGGFRGGRR